MTRALRVAHVLPFVGVGGTEHGTLRLATAVRGAGVESVALCVEEAAPVHGLFRGAGFEAAYWHPRDVAGWGRASFAYRTLQLAWELRRRRVDLVHCADVLAVTRQVVAAARLAGAGVVCHVRNRNDRLWEDQAEPLRAVRRFLFVSRATWRAFGHEVEPWRGTVIYDGIPVDERAGDARARAEARAEIGRELGIPDDAPLVGMVARVEPQKDFVTLARATGRLVREFPELRVLVVGGTDATPEQRAHFPEVQRAVAECGVADHVRFLGFRSDVPRLLQAVDVSVLATHWEGLPLVLWEAMAQGTPVVATAVDGVPEAIEDGATGLLVRHADDAQLADRLGGLLRDPAGRRRLGLAGQAHARAWFSTERFAEGVVRVYREAIRRGDAGAG